MKFKNKLGPVRSISLVDSVYEEVFKAIVSGNIRPGDRLVLEEVAKTLKVSVMPVREAIKKLEAINLVKIVNRRILVNTLSAETVRSLLEVRLLLDCQAAATAAKKRREDILPKLKKCLDQMSTTLNPEEYTKANREFHFTIYNEAGNTILLETINSLWERYSPYLSYALRVDWREPQWTGPHEGMFEAICKKDVKSARRFMAKDLKNAAKLIMEIL